MVETFQQEARVADTGWRKIDSLPEIRNSGFGPFLGLKTMLVVYKQLRLFRPIYSGSEFRVSVSLSVSCLVDLRESWK